MSKKAVQPSANWIAFQKVDKYSNCLQSYHPLTALDRRLKKRRKLEHGSSTTTNVSPPSPTPSTSTQPIPLENTTTTDNNPTRSALKKMVLGLLNPPPAQHLSGRYLAIDCEMVGIGIDGTESSLARVSVVNWYGVVQLDVFVRQRERVVDYRTRWSGIREKNMIGAKPFEEVQKQVADLVKDKILIGHAVHNDLKALLLSHPHQLTRDTQIYARKFNLTKSKFISLRNLVKDQLDLTIQDGEHNSVVDARATMAVFRMHKKEWEKGVKPIEISNASKKRKEKDRIQEDVDEDQAQGENDDTKSEPIPKNRKGVSSGLSTIIKRRGSSSTTTTKTINQGGKGKSSSITVNSSSGEKKAWWSELPKSGSKGSVRLAR